MRVLLTFTGFHDPFVPSAVEGQMDSGPILTVVGERPFDAVYLFGTPQLVERTEETQRAIKKYNPAIKVTILDVPLKDPTNYLGILGQLRSHFKSIVATYPDGHYSISVSSGTPHMHVCWILLAASGEIPAVIIQSTPPRFIPEGKSRVKEIKVTGPAFPKIDRPVLECDKDEDDDSEIASVCHELGIVGSDPLLLRALNETKTYAQYSGVHVLLLGETGTGKERFAQFFHRFSSSVTKALVTVNCSVIQEKIAESQLFGHKRGSFTGATSDQDGKFKSANGGIIFLDEIGELPLNIQAKLLRALEGEIEPVGSSKSVKVKVQVIAATNRDLKSMVKEGTFREDLYQRFHVSVQIPSLAQRRSDVYPLAQYLLMQWNAEHQKKKQFEPDALRKLREYSWPGNVRELRRVVHNAAMLCLEDGITPEAIRFDEAATYSNALKIPELEDGFNLLTFLEETKQRLIQSALDKTDNVQAKAARLLGLSPQALNQHLKTHKNKRR
jgi:DNA-binding NtrC family response regulator